MGGKKMKKRIIALALTAMITSMFVGCANKQSTTPSTTGGTDTKAKFKVGMVTD
jgi:hypothetical protein